MRRNEVNFEIWPSLLGKDNILKCHLMMMSSDIFCDEKTLYPDCLFWMISSQLPIDSLKNKQLATNSPLLCSYNQKTRRSRSFYCYQCCTVGSIRSKVVLPVFHGPSLTFLSWCNCLYDILKAALHGLVFTYTAQLLYPVMTFCEISIGLPQWQILRFLWI